MKLLAIIFHKLVTEGNLFGRVINRKTDLVLYGCLPTVFLHYSPTELLQLHTRLQCGGSKGDEETGTELLMTWDIVAVTFITSVMLYSLTDSLTDQLTDSVTVEWSPTDIE